MSQWYDVDIWQWVDVPDYEWGITGSGTTSVSLNQIFMDTYYVYAATSEGLAITSMSTENEISSFTKYGGYNSVWASDTHVYLASTYDGINYFDKAVVETIDEAEIVYSYPDITGNTVRSIHGNSRRIIASTTQGIDVIRRDNYYISHNTDVTLATKVFVTPEHDYYYYQYYRDGAYKIGRLNNNTGDWSNADIDYIVDSGFLEGSTQVNDFYVTEHTATSGTNNTLFVVTDLCAFVFDEETEEYKALTTFSGSASISGSYGIVGGDSIDFVAIWADDNTNINSGKVYVASTGDGAAFSVISLDTNMLHECYTLTRAGVVEEPLDSEDIEDIHIGSRGT